MVEWPDDDDDGDDDFFMRRRRPSLCSCPSRAVLGESNAPLAQQFTPVLVVGDILQAVFVGHTLPEIPPPPARGALELVVGTKALPAAILEVVAVPLLPVFAFKAMPAQHIIQHILVRHIRSEITTGRIDTIRWDQNFPFGT